MKVKQITVISMLTAFICVVAPFSIPVSIVPVTLSTLAVFIAATVSNAKSGIISVILYILLGAAGVPVFSGFSGGVSHLMSPTGGFIIGYIPMAVVTVLMIKRFSRFRLIYPLAMIAGNLLCYFCGVIWFAALTKSTCSAAIAVCVLPFVMTDLLKIAAASIVAPQIRKAVQKAKNAGS